MAPHAPKPDRFQLPTRIRSKRDPDDRLSHGMTLAERFAAHPGIEIVAPGGNANRVATDRETEQAQFAAYVTSGIGQTLLCSYQHTGIAVHGLNNRDRHQVVSRGWGRLLPDRVILFLPRDDSELDVCWDILQRATFRLAQPSVLPARRSVSSWDLPSYSRTTLQ